ncbi:hypothetical protein [Terrabacter carboxydivorans]|uniref:Integron gene cassette protein n=1 Tax=Terrabacter carboxydivorans TaxID=619730 RepID=A0ABN3MFI3_9MICO
MDGPDISVVELRAPLTLLLDAVEERFGSRLQFDEDFYWNVPLGDATRVQQDPELNLGSVIDDATSVREFLNRAPGDGIFIWHDVDHLVGVLRAIGRLDLPGS